MYKNIKWELAGDGKDSVYLVEGALDWLVWELIFGDRERIYWHAVMFFSFCLRVLAQLIWVLFCHKIQASRKLHFMTEGVFEVWAEEWIVNSLILKTGVSYTVYSLHILEYIFRLSWIKENENTETVHTSWSLSTHSGMSQAKPSWDALASSAAASFPKDHWDMKSWYIQKTCSVTFQNVLILCRITNTLTAE